MPGGNRVLKLVATTTFHRVRAIEAGQAPRDSRPIPAGPILFLGENEIAGGVGARRRSGGLEQVGAYVSGTMGMLVLSQLADHVIA